MTAEARAGTTSLLRSAAEEPQLEPIRWPKPAQAAHATSCRHLGHARCQCLLPASLGHPLFTPSQPPRCTAAPQANHGSMLRNVVRRTATMKAQGGCPRCPAEPQLLPSLWSPGRQSPPLPAAAAAGSAGSSQLGRAGAGSLPQEQGLGSDAALGAREKKTDTRKHSCCSNKKQ